MHDSPAAKTLAVELEHLASDDVQPAPILAASPPCPSSQRRSRRSEAASKAGSPTSGLGSIASQPRSESSTLAPWRSWCRSVGGVASSPSSRHATHRLVEQRPIERPPRGLPVARQLLRPARRGHSTSSSNGSSADGDRRNPRSTPAAIAVASSSSSTSHKPCPGLAPLDQERAALGIVLEQAHRSFAVPAGERRGLVLAVRLGEVDLEDCRSSPRRDAQHERDVAAGQRLTDLEPPLLGALGDEPGKPIEPVGATGHRRATSRGSTGSSRAPAAARRRSHSSGARAAASAGTPAATGARSPATPGPAAPAPGRRRRPLPRTRPR